MAASDGGLDGAGDARTGDDDEPVEHALTGFGVNAALVEEIRQRWEVDPSSVDPSWDAVFEAEEEAPAPAADDREAAAPRAAAPLARPAAPLRRVAPPPASAPTPELAGGLSLAEAEKHARVLRLIHSYRARGHRIAKTDPLGASPSYFPELDPAHYGFGHDDMERAFIAGDLPGGPVQTLRQILDRLRATYCRSVGVEFTHMQDPGHKSWVQRRLEETENATPLTTAERLRVLQKLAAAELFERFLHTKFVGQKRFSLEGGESLIPLLDAVVEEAPAIGVREIVFGMAHRGRLNVLSNVMERPLETLFSEFEDSPLLEVPFGSGDVKYHKGFSTDRTTASGASVHLSLTANPSHLELVDPVVEGRTRAKQMRAGDTRGRTILPLLIHGDAAVAGQGIVQEVLNLSRLAGYTTGGTLHVVVNNQIGFTTTPDEARSTLYSTDVMKIIQVPIFHVNGDDPDAVIHCVKEALAYRQRFNEDVVIELVCYRRHGHNEGDEPSFTQPILYEKIRKHPGVRRIYTDSLIAKNLLTQDQAQRLEADLNDQLQRALETIKTRPAPPDETFESLGPWVGFSRTRPAEEIDTGVPIERLTQVGDGLGRLPAGFHVHPKLAPLLERRRKVIAENGPVDWALAEALAFGSLLVEGTPVRLSGQDSSRGTFSHRHAAVTDQTTGEEYVPLDHLAETQARFEAIDSLLSEAAVLGFEYGYSLADPLTLVLWEAQFGDFANGAQAVIDQFIASAHAKWGRMNGLVMLLPHGYEGQGPEHSSARVERYLQLCAEENLQIANCTTPAQYFHLLRRQMRRNYRAPLVVFTPKSLLRAPQAASSPEDLVRGRFLRVIDDTRAAQAPGSVRRVLLSSGKVYYDLLDAREKRTAGGAPADVALVRVEELHPWPDDLVAQLIERYAQADTVFWVQEEPANMGAWTFVRERLQDALRPRQKLAYAGRAESASTAVGSLRVHKQQQAALVAAAFAGLG